jgi:hypothetical protein
MTSIEHHERPARINRQLMVIGGRSVESSDGRYIDVENPANRTTIGQRSVPCSGEPDAKPFTLFGRSN